MATENKSKNKFTNPVRLSHRNPICSQSELEAANTVNVWHKFILYNVEKHEKTIVLDTLIELCTPTAIFPVMFTMETENKATFLTMCRQNVISKLLNHNLQFKLPSGKIIYFDIVLRFLAFKDMQMSAQKIITAAIKSRFGKEQLVKKSLNLTNFMNDKTLTSLYCPLHVPVIFDAILSFCRGIFSASNNFRDTRISVAHFILRSNNLSNIQCVEKLFTFHFSKLDLRDNKLYDVQQLKPFSEYKITELWLDGNPLCSNYQSPADYISAVVAIFPSLQVLDGQIIGVEQKFLPTYHKHYINNDSMLSLVKQFIEHYFACYDQDDRIVLNGLYDTQALFSMTVGPISDNSHKQIIKSFATNRNLLKFVDYAKCTEFLLYGPEKIISALRREPATLHKMKYLDVDLLYSANNCFAVSVQGPFTYRKSYAPPMWFQRTLILVAKEDNEFCIINDQYHLDNCPASLNNVDLSELKFINDKSIPTFKPTLFSGAEKYQLLRLLEELTTMNPEHSDKILKEANWDIRLAIKTFMQNYVNNRIPTEAFRW